MAQSSNGQKMKGDPAFWLFTQINHSPHPTHPPPHPPTLETLRRAVDWSLWRPTSNPSKFTRLTHPGGGKQQTHASEGVGEEGEDVDRHGDGGGHLHQPHVHGSRLWPSLLCEKRLVRPSLQKLHGGFKLSLNILTF